MINAKEYKIDLFKRIIGKNFIKETFNYGKLGSLYNDGWKLCSECKILFFIDKNFCPICGKHLRTRPRNKGWKYNAR